jgi:hypothetical protein
VVPLKNLVKNNPIKEAANPGAWSAACIFLPDYLYTVKNVEAGYML